MKRFSIAAAMLIVVAGAARADCGGGTSDAEVKSCLGQELRDSDQRINAVYKALTASRDPAGKIALRDEQRAWLKRRDQACALDNKEADREKWLEGILADQVKTACVVRYTFARVAELDDMLKPTAAPAGILPSGPQPPKFQEAGPVAASDAFAFTDEGYQLQSRTSRARGKWYYELWIDRAHIAELGDVLLTTGFEGSGLQRQGVVHLINIRHIHQNLAPITVGWAIDLDNGTAYPRFDGVWPIQPGTTGGAELKLNQDYRAFLEGSSQLTELVRRGLVKVNFGETPFTYALPDGYRPFAMQ